MNSIWQVIRRHEYWWDFILTFLPFWVTFTVFHIVSVLTSEGLPTWIWSFYCGGTGLMLVIALYSAWYQGKKRG